MTTAAISRASSLADAFVATYAGDEHAGILAALDLLARAAGDAAHATELQTAARCALISALRGGAE